MSIIMLLFFLLKIVAYYSRRSVLIFIIESVLGRTNFFRAN